MDDITIERRNVREGCAPTCAWMSIDTDDFTAIVFVGQTKLLRVFAGILSNIAKSAMMLHEIGEVGVFFLGVATDAGTGKAIVGRISVLGDEGMQAYADRVVEEIESGSVKPMDMGILDRTQFATTLALVWEREVKMAAGTLEQN